MVFAFVSVFRIHIHRQAQVARFVSRGFTITTRVVVAVVVVVVVVVVAVVVIIIIQALVVVISIRATVHPKNYRQAQAARFVSRGFTTMTRVVVAVVVVAVVVVVVVVVAVASTRATVYAKSIGRRRQQGVLPGALQPFA